MSIYGSEFHDTTVKFTLEAQLERNGRPVESPRFASIVQVSFISWTEKSQAILYITVPLHPSELASYTVCSSLGSTHQRKYRRGLVLSSFIPC